MRSFNQWLEEAKKKTTEKYPVSADGIQKGANGGQGGVNDKNDSTDDRTESVEEGFAAPSKPDSKPTPSHHSGGSNAPSNAKSQQTAANAVVARNMAASIAAKKQQEKEAEDQKKMAQKRAEAEKAKAMNPPSSSQKPTTVSKPMKAMGEELVTEGRPRKDANPDEGPSKHPINQLRLVISTRGMHHFEHKNGKKTAMSPPTAHKLLARHDNMKTAAEKDEYARRMHHSPESLRDVIHGKPAEHKPKISLGGSKNVGGTK
jgi:hypothetical protein